MELKAAFPKTIPVLAGYLFLGITYGILAVTSGLPAWMPVLTALVVYTGSMEFLLVSILLAPFNPFSVLATTLMVGARHIFYGLTMLTKYRGTGKAKFYLIYTTSVFPRSDVLGSRSGTGRIFRQLYYLQHRRP